MQTALRHPLPIVCGLALFTFGSYLVVTTTSRSWFEDDVRRRAELALRGGGAALSQSWARGDRASVERVLEEITRDERILAAVVSSPDGAVFAQTSEFPRSLTCSRFVARSLVTVTVRAWSRAARVISVLVDLLPLPV